MGVRLNKDTIEALKEIKEIYDLRSIDSATKLAIRNTPLPVDIVTQPPAFILKLFDMDEESYFEEIVTWDMLKNSKQGDIFDCEEILKEDTSKFETATVLFKDDKGVFIKFELHRINEEPIVDVVFYSFI